MKAAEWLVLNNSKAYLGASVITHSCQECRIVTKRSGYGVVRAEKVVGIADIDDILMGINRMKYIQVTQFL